MEHEIITINDTKVGVDKGIKSIYDFKVKYRQPGKHERTPKHIHLIVDLCMKRTGNEGLTLKFMRRLLSILKGVQPETQFPPTLQFYRRNNGRWYRELNEFGEYPVDFLMVIFELIMIQEKTNYPDGILNRRVFESFIRGDDIYKVVTTATHRW
jgi:hypothetical protein